MPYLVFPLQVSAITATVWVGAINENFNPAQIALAIDQTAVPLDPNWTHWQSEDSERTIDFQRVTIEGRQANTEYKLECSVNNTVQSTAKLTTLPDRLPLAIDPKPFIVLLGSCFYEPDDGGRAGRVFRRLPVAAKPHVKLLCGDQVYLDNPWYQLINLFPQSRNSLEKTFLKKYLKNWLQESDGAGYRELLKAGANLFCPDDHEYWNNAPTAASYVTETWSADGRRTWRDACEPLYRIFQTGEMSEQPPELIRTFDVGQLSFFIADLRTRRDENRINFLPDNEFGILKRWVENLTGPGVLVIGQVIFAGKTSELSGRIGDFGLPDYKQYEELARTLLSAKHSILLLTGDVHFGRVSRCPLGSGAELIEVISSPMSLVSSLGGRAADPPEEFPSFPVPGIVPAKIDHRPEKLFKLEGNHFTTLEFMARGAKVIATIKYWMIGKDENVSLSYTLSEIQLQ